MNGQNLRSASRREWASENPGLTRDELKVGTLLRIADATEAMARRYNDLLDRNRFLERACESRSSEIEHLERRISSLKGQITKMKKKGSA